MNKLHTRISRIENFLSILLTTAKVSSHIFVGENLPAAIDKTWNDMLLISPNSQSDLSSHTTGSVSLFLYARPTGAYLEKNVKMLDSMESKLDAAIESCSNEHYTISVNWRDQGYSADRNLHFNVVNIRVVVR